MINPVLASLMVVSLGGNARNLEDTVQAPNTTSPLPCSRHGAHPAVGTGSKWRRARPRRSVRCGLSRAAEAGARAAARPRAAEAWRRTPSADAEHADWWRDRGRR